MSKVFYGMSGSDANETQAKLVWYYSNLRGTPNKKKIISRERGYHGCSVVSGSMTGMSFYHDHMDLPRAGILHTGAPHHYWGAEAGETELEFSKRRADELEALILREDPDTIGGLHRRARTWHRRHHPTAARLLGRSAKGPQEIRHPAHRRRSHHRFRSHRLDVRIAALRHRT